MDYNRIDILLNKYWECETSLAEEKELREFFARNAGDAKWTHEAALFRYFEQSRNEGGLGEFFDHRVLDEISRTTGRREGKVRHLWQNIAKVAAAILILVTAAFFMVKDVKENPQLGTIEDPQKAFEETKKALLMISQTMGTGKKQVQKVSIFNEAQETIKNDLEPEFENKKDNKENK